MFSIWVALRHLQQLSCFLNVAICFHNLVRKLCVRHLFNMLFRVVRTVSHEPELTDSSVFSAQARSDAFATQTDCNNWSSSLHVHFFNDFICLLASAAIADIHHNSDCSGDYRDPKSPKQAPKLRLQNAVVVLVLTFEACYAVL